MKRNVFFLSALLSGLFFFSCADGKYAGVPDKYTGLLETAFLKAGENAGELEKAMKDCRRERREGMAYLIAYMPERDLTALKGDFLLENVNLAYDARERFVWAKEVPDSIFFNDVLPYVCLNETRENWRADFYKRFAPVVDGCTTLMEAAVAVNKAVRGEVKVEYNTKRKKPDQSPFESMEQGMASCSGLSILLTDAFRSVGIPSRIAGTPNWHDNRGNHNWSEVWVDGKWYFTEYYYEAFNKSWFVADAGKAVSDEREHAIYASSYRPTGISFPLVWDESIDYVHAFNVSEDYIRLAKQQMADREKDGRYVEVSVMMFKNRRFSRGSGGRVAANVDVFCGENQMGGGRTAGPTQDMNDTYRIWLEKNKTYSFKYFDAEQRWKSVDVAVAEKPMMVRLYMED